MKLYREVRIETADDLDQLEEYYVKETSPGGAWQIVLVPIEAEEEHKGIPLFPRPADAPWPPRSTPNQDVDGRWYYIDEDGRSIGCLGDQPFHDLMVAWIDSLPRITRYTTPWEPQQ